VELEALEPVLDAQAATAAGARLVHPGPFPTDPNVVVNAQLTTEGFSAALRMASHVVEIEVSSGRQSAMPMEARAAHVGLDASTGRMTLSTTTQAPHVLRTGICDLLGIPEDELRVVAPDVGGGFGAKQALAREDLALVSLARRLRRNIAWVETREENFMASWHSREQLYRVRGAFNGDAELTALEADILVDVGAYSCYPYTFGVEPLMAFAELPGAYKVKEYSVRSRAVLSNKCPIAPYRGVSRPVQVLAMERLMDVAAKELGVDRLELRRRNLVSEYPHETPTGLVLDPSSHHRALELAEQIVSMEEFSARQSTAREQGRYLGLGFSCFSERTGYGTPAFAKRAMAITPGYEQVQLGFDPTGNLILRIGASPHGQGLRTTLAQVAADAVGVHFDKVRVVHSDTDQTPYGWGTYASRSMVIAGGATKLAGTKMREKLARVAAEVLECAADDIVVEGGMASVRGTDASIPVAQVARFAYHSSHKMPQGEEPGLNVVATYDPPGTFSNAVHIAEVEVDIETGQVDINRFVIVEDAGILVNPMIVEGQVHGGVAQGVANALYEELVYNENGILTTSSLMDYLVPTIVEIPHMEIHHLETLSDATVTGAKGVGEGGTIGAPAAIINAISDALTPFGLEFFRIPTTPQAIRSALRTPAACLEPTTVQGASS
jgi:carbon-monoxide dehydrogenase large subunit